MVTAFDTNQRSQESARDRGLHDLKAYLMKTVPQLQNLASDESFPLQAQTSSMMEALVDWCLLTDEYLND